MFQAFDILQLAQELDLSVEDLLAHIQQVRQQKLLNVSSQEAVYSVRLLQALTPEEAKAITRPLLFHCSFQNPYLVSLGVTRPNPHQQASLSKTYTPLSKDVAPVLCYHNLCDVTEKRLPISEPLLNAPKVRWNAPNRPVV